MSKDKPSLQDAADRLIGKRKKLTFDLDPNLHRRFKQWCAGHGVTMVDWLSQKIDEQVNES